MAELTQQQLQKAFTERDLTGTQRPEQLQESKASNVTKPVPAPRLSKPIVQIVDSSMIFNNRCKPIPAPRLSKIGFIHECRAAISVTNAVELLSCEVVVSNMEVRDRVSKTIACSNMSSTDANSDVHDDEVELLVSEVNDANAIINRKQTEELNEVDSALDVMPRMYRQLLTVCVLSVLFWLNVITNLMRKPTAVSCRIHSTWTDIFHTDACAHDFDGMLVWIFFWDHLLNPVIEKASSAIHAVGTYKYKHVSSVNVDISHFLVRLMLVCTPKLSRISKFVVEIQKFWVLLMSVKGPYNNVAYLLRRVVNNSKLIGCSAICYWAISIHDYVKLQTKGPPVMIIILHLLKGVVITDTTKGSLFTEYLAYVKQCISNFVLSMYHAVYLMIQLGHKCLKLHGTIVPTTAKGPDLASSLKCLYNIYSIPAICW